ncbi:MAG: tail fiber protein, partial [Alphaproteobacteria bacterium]|nr:tail fiber protein [Alphaproteobacteria bacterium]
AQTCAQAPSCPQLGYTKSVADCAGKTILYCPFDATKAYCVDEITCASLGFTDTIAECPGSYVKCPSDATKGKCDFEASPGDLKYSLRTSDHNGWLLCNGRSYSSAQYPELYSAISGSFGTNLPSYSGYFLKAAATSSASTFKTAQEAGLPNITGYFSAGLGAQNGSYKDGSGAISKSSTYNMAMKGGNSDDWGRNFYFNASKSNSIYGKSSTVTPQNYSANVFIYTGRKKGSATNLSCSVGDYYYSDGTCSSTYTSSKTLLGMVNSVYSYTGYKQITYVWGGNKTASSRTAAQTACRNTSAGADVACDQHVNGFTSKTITSNSVVTSPNNSSKKYILCFNENSYFTCNSSTCTRAGSNFTGSIYYYCYNTVNIYN